MLRELSCVCFSAYDEVHRLSLSSWFDGNVRAALIGGIVGAIATLVGAGAPVWYQSQRDAKTDAEKASEQVIANQITKRVDGAALKESDLSRKLADMSAKLASSSDVQAKLEKIDARLNDLHDGLAILKGQSQEQSKTIDRLYGDVSQAIRMKIRGSVQQTPSGLNEQANEVLNALRLAPIFKVDVDLDEYAAVRRHLSRVDQPSGAYWSLASFVVTKESGDRVPLPQPAGPPRTSLVLTGSVVSRLYILLDGAILKSNIFTDTVFEYRGGPVRIENCVFRNCRFILRVSSPPPDTGKSFSRTLMASTSIDQVKVLTVN